MKNSRRIAITIIFLAARTLCVYSQALCQNAPGKTDKAVHVRNQSSEDSQDRLIAAVFRISAKGVVSVTDMEKFKKNSIDRVNAMDEAAFHARYMDFYEHVYDCRTFVEASGLRDSMTKAEAVERIKSLDKQRLYTMVDALPDAVIVNECNRYFFKHQEEVPNSNDKGKIFESLQRMLDEIKKKYFGG